MNFNHPKLSKSRQSHAKTPLDLIKQSNLLHKSYNTKNYIYKKPLSLRHATPEKQSHQQLSKKPTTRSIPKGQIKIGADPNKISKTKSKPKERQRYSIQALMESHDLQFLFDPPLITNWGQQDIKKQKILHREDDYSKVKLLGQGSTGKVWMVSRIADGKFFAMKQMCKAKAIAFRNIEYVMNQRQLLPNLKHPSITQIVSSFQTRTHLYLILELMPGRDLRLHLNVVGTFTEQQVRFFAACIFSALEYLHTNNIIHRDIKPENLVFDREGYLRLTDFGVARKVNNDQGCYGGIEGTLGYIAPEVFKISKYRFEVDYFSLGVVLYEAMIGTRPFLSKNRHQLILLFKKYQQQSNRVLTRQRQMIQKKNIPQNWSIQSVDFINKLLSFNPQTRLGFKNTSQIKNHNWLRDFPWSMLQKNELKPPYDPFKNDSPQISHKYKEQGKQNDLRYLKSVEENNDMLKKGMFHQLFQGYTFCGEQQAGDGNKLVNQPSKMIDSTGPSYEIREK